jgi:hypothetical protein
VAQGINGIGRYLFNLNETRKPDPIYADGCVDSGRGVIARQNK